MEYIALSPNIGVKSVDETVRFYTEILGFKLMTSIPSPKGNLQWAMVANGGATIMFQEIGNLLEECPLLSERQLLGTMTFYIKMKDMNILYEKLQGTKYIAEEKHKTFYDTIEFAIFDNNGNILTISETKSK